MWETAPRKDIRLPAFLTSLPAPSCNIPIEDDEPQQYPPKARVPTIASRSLRVPFVVYVDGLYLADAQVPSVSLVGSANPLYSTRYCSRPRALPPPRISSPYCFPSPSAFAKVEVGELVLYELI